MYEHGDEEYDKLQPCHGSMQRGRGFFQLAPPCELSRIQRRLVLWQGSETEAACIKSSGWREV